MIRCCYNRITNYEAVTSFLGKWPSFDDFEVVSILLERSHDGEEPWPTLTVRFLGLRSDFGPEDSDRKNYLLTLWFGGVDNLKLEGFNYQNAINGFTVAAKWSERLNQEVFNVEIIQGFGVGCAFECSEIKVMNVTSAS